MIKQYLLKFLIPLCISFSSSAQCNNPIVIETDDFESISAAPWVVPGATYPGSQNTQSFGPFAGSRHVYLNFVNNNLATAYARTVNVCPDSSFQIDCMMHDTWGGAYNVIVQIYDSGTLLNSQNITAGSGPYVPYSSGLLSSTSGTVTWSITNNQTWGNNDFALDHFSVTQCNCDPLVLPVELVNFNAMAKANRRVELEWQTVSEKDNDYFQVHRSINMENWEFVAQVSGAGNSTDLLNYFAIDNTPHIGLSYYKLTQVDFDDTQSSAKIKSVLLNPGNESALSIYPNPTSDLLQVNGKTNQPYNLKLFNSIGKEVEINVVASGNNSVTLSISNIPIGVYYLRSQNLSYKIVKE